MKLLTETTKLSLNESSWRIRKQANALRNITFVDKRKVTGVTLTGLYNFKYLDDS